MDDRVFKISILSSVLIGVILIWIVMVSLRKRGVDINSNKVILKVALSVMVLVIFFPIWFVPDVSLLGKLLAMLLGILGGILNLGVVNSVGKKVRKSIGIKSKWDKDGSK